MVSELLAQVEATLDPARPTGVQVLAYGEVSAALIVPGLEGYVAKRMSGFRDAEMAAAYMDVVEQYIAVLTDSGVPVVPTELIPVTRAGRPPVVYLVQPLMSDLGNAMLHTAGDEWLEVALKQVLDLVQTLHDRTGQPQVAVDAQLSNWSFASSTPTLIDVGTPFMRIDGRHLFDQEILLSAIPPGARAYYRRTGTVGEYMDDYFQPRLVTVDLLGNFIKEGVAARLLSGIKLANSWLTRHGYEPVSRSQVEEYYKQDAATLELFLRARRLDRAVKRALGREYDFLLPGPVKR